MNVHNFSGDRQRLLYVVSSTLPMSVHNFSGDRQRLLYVVSSTLPHERSQL